MVSHAKRWAGLAIPLSVAGCGFVRDEILVGPYRLVAVDISEDMSLCRSVEVWEFWGRLARRMDAVFRAPRDNNIRFLWVDDIIAPASPLQQG